MNYIGQGFRIAPIKMYLFIFGVLTIFATIYNVIDLNSVFSFYIGVYLLWQNFVFIDPYFSLVSIKFYHPIFGNFENFSRIFKLNNYKYINNI